jgi:hypothetical protein
MGNDSGISDRSCVLDAPMTTIGQKRQLTQSLFLGVKLAKPSLGHYIIQFFQFDRPLSDIFPDGDATVGAAKLLGGNNRD